MRMAAVAILCLLAGIPVIRAQDVVLPKEQIPLGTASVRDVTRYLVQADQAKPSGKGAGGMREDANSVQFSFIADSVELHRQALAK